MSQLLLPEQEFSLVKCLFISIIIPLVLTICDELFDTTALVIDGHYALDRKGYLKLREQFYHPKIDYKELLNKYIELTFSQLFRMKTETFLKLMEIILENNEHSLIKKIYRGGNFPFHPEKSLLIFLWYEAHNDTLLCIADRFGTVPSTVLKIVNAYLYIICRIKYKYIKYPHNDNDRIHIQNGFASLPGVIGAIDGTHIKIKVPQSQQDSYIDRFHDHSINLTAMCTANHILTYVYAGFSGCAHDSRVFAHSNLNRNIEINGKEQYFPNPECHIIGDGAFPIRTWLLVPYKRHNLNRKQKYFNFCLSSSRVSIENKFALLKGRWARLKFINTYAVSKAIEIIQAACVLYNFCLLNHDKWNIDRVPLDHCVDEDLVDDDRLQMLMGETKRHEIANELWNNRNG